MNELEKSMDRESAEVAADALLLQEPRFSQTRLGRVAQFFRSRSALNGQNSSQDSIPRMPDPYGYEPPGSPYWNTARRESMFD